MTQVGELRDDWIVGATSYVRFIQIWFLTTTLPETNIAPENGWLEYYFPIGEAYFQGLR